VWEKGLLGDLLVMLHGFVFMGGRDCWVWRPGKEGKFCVNSCFKMIQRRTLVGSNLTLGRKKFLNIFGKAKQNTF